MAASGYSGWDAVSGAGGALGLDARSLRNGRRPRLQRALALAYVKYDYLAPGTKIKVAGMTGVVTELPFIRGSWYEGSAPKG